MTMLLFSWSWARFSSAAETVSCLRRVSSSSVRARTFSVLSTEGAGVDGEGAGVCEWVHLGVDGVGEALVFADGLEEAGGHAAA